MKLGERLETLASFVPQGTRLADIGTDHAYIPIKVVEKNIAISAIAGDVHSGPFEAAKDNVKNLGLEHKISVRLGNGLAVLSPGEADTVVIAGMGGSTIVQILSSEPCVTKSLKRLILQPMVGAGSVRRWLAENQWIMIDEALVEDDGRLYEILVAEQGLSLEVEPILHEIGVILWQEKPALLKRHIESLMAQTKRVLVEMASSEKAQHSTKFHEYTEKLKQLEAKRQCL